MLHHLRHFVLQLFTIICSLFMLIVICSAADQWAPNLRVAVFPLEPHSSDTDYGTSSLLENRTVPYHSHHHHHYDRNPPAGGQSHHYHSKRRLSYDGANDKDNDAFFCSMEQNRAQWAPFGNWSQCSDSCGGCGSRWRTRECRRGHGRCECQGLDREEEACNLEVCIYPRKACCAGRRHTSIDGKFACERIENGVQTEVKTKNTP
ncbi:hypothetical protein niasHT_028564 [Heterodera trifolii]|uniref:Uncharacterized protein n=1 Tax=Heterodera trifolii TaxID=157864 RepID=A0ABD2JNY1_9BILA